MRWTPYKPIIDVDIASFDDGLPDRELHTLEVEIAPYQAGTGDPSGENIRPISGWKKANIVVNGVNQWNEQTEKGGYDPDSGLPLPGSNLASKTKTIVKPNTKYCFHAGRQRVSRVFWYEPDGTFLPESVPNAANPDFEATSYANAHLMNLQMPTGYGDVYTNDISVNYPAKDHSYHPYVGAVTEVDWEDDAGTVYGGTLDVLTGILTVTKGYIASYNGEELPGAWISDRDVYVAGESPTTGAEVVYDLAEPVEYELDPVEIRTLEAEGLNNIFADTGKILKCYYYIDTSYFRRFFMINTGYVLLDGGNIDLSTSDAQLIDGAWDRTITAINTGKPIWAYNTKYGDGKPLSPVPVFCWYLSATSIVIVGATLHIIVGNDDYCVVQDVAPSVGDAKSEDTKKKSK